MYQVHFTGVELRKSSHRQLRKLGETTSADDDDDDVIVEVETRAEADQLLKLRGRSPIATPAAAPATRAPIAITKAAPVAIAPAPAPLSPIEKATAKVHASEQRVEKALAAFDAALAAFEKANPGKGINAFSETTKGGTFLRAYNSARAEHAGDYFELRNVRGW